MRTVAEARERLNLCGDQHVCVAIWREDDVFERAGERGMTISREQAQNVIDLMDSKQDCSLGISWDTMDVYLDELKTE